MVLSLLISFGTVAGAHEGIKASQAKARKEEHRSRKNNLVVHCPKSSQFSAYLESRRVVLSGNRLFIDTGTVHDAPFGHPFEGYYLPYPDSRFPGLVTTITHEAPIMNWVFVDPITYQLRFGIDASPSQVGRDFAPSLRRVVFGDCILTLMETDYSSALHDQSLSSHQQKQERRNSL
ncbi:hypothetical protein CTRI78_v007855 [Colletotrichum trifolii]|uniref:Uncharacterized protein n=1 Tax=Colletotrichum trifolii TaxID=5466 RepID=A0A4R8R3Y0_COLTR|nr:hypothetical protein CTRI78_v007855 [Colletotrichum trifolii]